MATTIESISNIIAEINLDSNQKNYIVSIIEFFKLNLLFLRKKASNLIKLDSIQLQENFPEFYYYNLSVIATHNKQNHLALFYIKKCFIEIEKKDATTKNSNLQKINNLQLYNLGINFGQLGNFDISKSIFLKLTQDLKSVPPKLLIMSFMRLAETYIEEYHIKNKSLNSLSEFEEKATKNEMKNLLEESSDCLMTCLAIFQKEKNTDFEKLASFHDLQFSIHCHVILSWIHLEMESYVSAYTWSNKACQLYYQRNFQPKNPNSLHLTPSEESKLLNYYYISRTYLSESQMRLGNFNEALSTLFKTPVDLNNNLIKGPFGDLCAPDAFRLSNIACVYLVQGNLVLAKKNIQNALQESPGLNSALFLKKEYNL